MMYKHLFFDLDHTIWDFEANAKDTLGDLYELHQLHQRGIADFDAFFERYSYHNHRLWARYTQGLIRQDELRWKRMWLALLDFKIGDEALARGMAAEFLNRLPFKKKLFPYTLEILNYLKDKGYQLHLVTNGFDTVQHHKLASSNLKDFFVEVITSERSNSLKPHKAIFDFALNVCCARSHECVMIGDNLDADIQGGIDAGMDTVFVNHLNIEPHIKATYVINHLKELEKIF